MSTSALPADRDGFRFRGGAKVIDLPATRQARLSPEPRELLAAPADLSRWLVSAGLAASPPAVGTEDLATARSLREAIYVLAGTRSGSAAKAARDQLNGIAAGMPAVPQLGNDGSMNLVGSAGALLVTLAREAVQLFGGADAGLIRQCQSPNCTLYFIDTSRRGDRQWCSMSACGNKAKAAGFRRRQGKKPRTR